LDRGRKGVSLALLDYRDQKQLGLIQHELGIEFSEI
jgi:hypothetical protein